MARPYRHSLFTIQDMASPYRHSFFPTDFSQLFLGKKHQSATKSITCFFVKPKEKVVPLEDEDMNKKSCATSSSKVQSILDVLVKWSIATKAEIMWAVKCVSFGFCINSCANINSMFKSMFPDSNIASAFSMAPTKVLYVINHGLATHFKQILKDGITKSDCYVVSFDESLNDITQTCQMDILIRYWDSNDSVKVR